MKYYNIKNFVLVQNSKNPISLNGYDKIPISPNIMLYYEKSDKFSFFSLLMDDKRIELQWNNPYFPIFKYSDKNFSIVTNVYKIYFDLKLRLTINQNNLIEFILFNTTTGNATFHNEVERVFNINKIIIDENQIKYDFVDEKLNGKTIIDIYQNQVEKIITNTLHFKHGIFLSGGGESRINAAIAQYYGLQKEFITWGHPKDKEYIIASKIANKLNTTHRNIRPNLVNLPYKELLLKTGFLVNMQYAYRYSVVKQLFEIYNYDLIWTGWGDINGYPVCYQPSELFSDYYLGLYYGKKRLPIGWNIDWLKNDELEYNEIVEQIKENPSLSTFFSIKEKILAPRIYGSVLGSENTLGSIIAPWFNSDIYSAVENEENLNPKIIRSKLFRTLWKNELYYQLIKFYCPSLNYIKNAKGYYPWMIQRKTGLAGIFVSALLKKWHSRKAYPFDETEDRSFIKSELEKILDANIELFDKKGIKKIIENYLSWRGPDIFENFKLIQIHWFLTQHSSS